MFSHLLLTIVELRDRNVQSWRGMEREDSKVAAGSRGVEGRATAEAVTTASWIVLWQPSRSHLVALFIEVPDPVVLNVKLNCVQRVDRSSIPSSIDYCRVPEFLSDYNRLWVLRRRVVLTGSGRRWHLMCAFRRTSSATPLAAVAEMFSESACLATSCRSAETSEHLFLVAR